MPYACLFEEKRKVCLMAPELRIGDDKRARWLSVEPYPPSRHFPNEKVCNQYRRFAKIRDRGDDDILLVELWSGADHHAVWGNRDFQSRTALEPRSDIEEQRTSRHDCR